MSRHSVLVVDDDAGIRFPLRKFLEHKDFEVLEADGYEQTMEVIQGARPDGVILDYFLPDGDALQLLRQLRASDPDLPVVVLTAHGSIDLAVRAIQEGADHFLTKPVELQALWVVIERMLSHRRSRQKEIAGHTSRDRGRVNPFIGISPAIRRLEVQVKRVLATDRPVLLQGETGTGKGELARWMHENGPRKDEAFVELNCAGLAREFLETELFGHEKGAFTGAVNAKRGLLEVAHHGSILLDEIGDMDPAVQPKLLKVLEDLRFRRLGETRDRIVDVRLIAATHQNLQSLTQAGSFRPDLYFRISALPLMVPALRERAEDIPLLARSLLSRLAVELGRPEASLTEAALKKLQSAKWPGNIRELRNVLERALLLGEGDRIDQDDLWLEDVSMGAGSSMLGLTLEEVERHHIEAVLKDEQGKVARAAERLGVPRSSLYQKLKRYGLTVADGNGSES